MLKLITISKHYLENLWSNENVKLFTMEPSIDPNDLLLCSDKDNGGHLVSVNPYKFSRDRI